MSPFKKMMYGMPAYKHDHTVAPKRIEQDPDQDVVTFLFDEGTLVATSYFKITY